MCEVRPRQARPVGLGGLLGPLHSPLSLTDDAVWQRAPGGLIQLRLLGILQLLVNIGPPGPFVSEVESTVTLQLEAKPECTQGPVAGDPSEPMHCPCRFRVPRPHPSPLSASHSLYCPHLAHACISCTVGSPVSYFSNGCRLSQSASLPPSEHDQCIANSTKYGRIALITSAFATTLRFNRPPASLPFPLLERTGNKQTLRTHHTQEICEDISIYPEHPSGGGGSESD